MLRRQRAARATKNHSRRERLCVVLSPPQFGNLAKPAVSLIQVAKPSYTTRTLGEIGIRYEYKK